jgi:hypothetical protein
MTILEKLYRDIFVWYSDLIFESKVSLRNLRRLDIDNMATFTKSAICILSLMGYVPQKCLDLSNICNSHFSTALPERRDAQGKDGHIKPTPCYSYTVTTPYTRSGPCKLPNFHVDITPFNRSQSTAQIYQTHVHHTQCAYI